ncbi:MAG: QueT transporter family protein [Limnochordia bacterium]|jgi:uncharacterized membrane protein|nr:QueT transporter family protein [Limnochordia bacterium]MDD2629499.1 QueT transporter family protein [Limnochordia bacterium]MDD4518190.1 QueT transporter family protein [Limnochordia bacterium]
MQRKALVTILRGALIAALYVALVMVMPQPFSFGVIQFRVAEGLVLLPMLYGEAVWGLYIGAILANILGGLGPWDIFGGSLVTLVAAYITYRYRFTWIAYVAPIVLNGLLVSAYLHFIYEVPYWLMVGSISISEAVVVLGLGVPLIRILQKTLM